MDEIFSIFLKWYYYLNIHWSIQHDSERIYSVHGTCTFASRSRTLTVSMCQRWSNLNLILLWQGANSLNIHSDAFNLHSLSLKWISSRNMLIYHLQWWRKECYNKRMNEMQRTNNDNHINSDRSSYSNVRCLTKGSFPLCRYFFLGQRTMWLSMWFRIELYYLPQSICFPSLFILDFTSSEAYMKSSSE